MKSSEFGPPAIDETEFDALFDVYLRPLKSGNARRIFRILSEEKAAGAITTLDIQAKLKKRGVKLGKKEINGWLHSLDDAGLAEKGDERGKPTTIEYDDKYTFDLWSLTGLGEEIARGIPRVLGTNSSLFKASPERSIHEISKMDHVERALALRRLGEISMLASILQELSRAGGELDGAELMRRLRPNQNALDRALSSLSNSSPGEKLVIRRRRREGFKVRLLSLIGIRLRETWTYGLTEDGARLAEALWPGEGLGH